MYRMGLNGKRIEEMVTLALGRRSSAFPTIERIEPVLAAIDGCKEFRISHYNGYQVIDYRVEHAQTFPLLEGDDVAQERAALRRECRGLVFDPEGRICCRKFHKFFQLGQRQETTIDAIDWEGPFAVLEKLDGTLVAPVRWGAEAIVWTTRGGPSPIALQAARWSAARPRLMALVEDALSLGWTPLFEWCSREHPIVLDYPETRLVLTAMRQMKSGLYLTHRELSTIVSDDVYDVELIHCYGSFSGEEDARHWESEAASLTAHEGFVLWSEDGRGYKIKSPHYGRLHRLLAHDRPEVYGWRYALAGEISPLLAQLPSDMQLQLGHLEQLLLQRIGDKARQMQEFVDEARADIAMMEIVEGETPKGLFAKQWVPAWRREERKLLFRIWGGDDALETLQQHLARALQSAKGIAEVRACLDLSAADMLGLYASQDEVTPRSSYLSTHADARTLIVGDVHGCVDELRGLLDDADYTRDDMLVMVGDLIHHGPDSLGVIEFLCGLRNDGYRLELVQGNHDTKMLKDLSQRSFYQELFGTVYDEQKGPVLEEWVCDMSEEAWTFVSDALLYCPLPSHGALVVHAGIPWERHALPLAHAARCLARNQRRAAAALQFLRYERRDRKQDAVRHVKAGREKEGDWFWAQRYDGRFGHVFYGHHPYLQSLPQEWPHATGLDLGCVIGGHLAAAILEPGSDVVSYVTRRAHSVYSKPHRIDEWADVRLGLVPMPEVRSE